MTWWRWLLIVIVVLLLVAFVAAMAWNAYDVGRKS
jgi:flagellar basal body-associated protein FliL